MYILIIPNNKIVSTAHDDCNIKQNAECDFLFALKTTAPGACEFTQMVAAV